MTIQAMTELANNFIESPTNIEAVKYAEIQKTRQQLKIHQDFIFYLDWVDSGVDAHKIFYFVEQFWTNEEW